MGGGSWGVTGVGVGRGGVGGLRSWRVTSRGSVPGCGPFQSLAGAGAQARGPGQARCPPSWAKLPATVCDQPPAGWGRRLGSPGIAAGSPALRRTRPALGLAFGLERDAGRPGDKGREGRPVAGTGP